MRSDKYEAKILRQQGRSYSEIAQELSVSRSTLSLWLRKEQLSESAKTRLKSKMTAGSDALVLRNKLQTEKALERANKARSFGVHEIVKERTGIESIGAALYWAEGYKRLRKVGNREISGHAVALSNSDPELVKCFIRYLLYLEVPVSKIKLQIRVFGHSNANKLKVFWKQMTELHEANISVVFQKESISSQRMRSFDRLPFGTVQVRVDDTALFYRILGHIEGLKKIG